MATKMKARPIALAARPSTKTRIRPDAGFAELDLLTEYWLTPPITTEERLSRIRSLGQRIHSYVQFMIAIGKLSGTSTEAKDKAVSIFYDRLVTFERELARIQEELQLG